MSHNLPDWPPPAVDLHGDLIGLQLTDSTGQTIGFWWHPDHLTDLADPGIHAALEQHRHQWPHAPWTHQADGTYSLAYRSLNDNDPITGPPILDAPREPRSTP